jgi:leader peptidase (prepilin peptidase) / N-methyltransferase
VDLEQVASLGIAGAGTAVLAALLRRPVHQLSVPFGQRPQSDCPRCTLGQSSAVTVTVQVRPGLRCVTCGRLLPPISLPLEALAAFVGILTVARLGPSIAAICYLWLAAAGLALCVIDYRVHRLPNALVYPTYVVGLGGLALAAIVTGDVGRYLRALAAMALVLAIFLLLYVLGRGAIGFGDVKLSGVLGLYLGFLGWSPVLAGLALAVVSNGVAALVLLLSGQANRRSELPLGPFLIGGAFLATFGGLDALRAVLSALFG